MDLKGRSFLTLKDYTPQEIIGLLDLAASYKEKKKQGIAHDTFRGRNIALIFEKTSTRTRCSFEVAAHDLGIGTTYLDPSGSQIGKKNLLRIQRVCWVECMMELNTVDLNRQLWKNLHNMQVCLFGMD